VRAQDINGTPGAYSGTISATTGAAAAYSCPVTGTATVCYFYDEAGRLKAASHDDGAQRIYVLDAAGNRLSSNSMAASPVTAPTLSTPSHSATSVALLWSNSSGGDGTFNYTVTRTPQGATPQPPATTATTLLDAGLNPSTPYTYTVTGTDHDGISATSNAVAVTTCSAPTATLTVTAVSATSITLTFSATGGCGGFTYSLQREGTTLPCTSSSNPCPDTGLMSSTLYHYTLTATDSANDQATAKAQQTTNGQLPGAPGTPVVTNITATTATVSWSVASGTVTAYEYSLNGGAWIGVGGALSANLSGLSPNTPYTVQVHAVNALGAGPAASSAPFTTPPASITDTPVLVVGEKSSLEYGFCHCANNTFGQMTPNTTSNGYHYESLYDLSSSAGHYQQSIFSITGLTADPGQSWLTSVTALGITRAGATASYSFANSTGSAIWIWQIAPFGFTFNSSPTVTVVHK
jgi:hypothetical protein